MGTSDCVKTSKTGVNGGAKSHGGHLGTFGDVLFLGHLDIWGRWTFGDGWTFGDEGTLGTFGDGGHLGTGTFGDVLFLTTF